MSGARAKAKKKHPLASRARPKRPKTPAKGKAGVPAGRRLRAAQQALRDTLIVVRKGQGWTWEVIAEEAGISVSAAKRAYAAKRDAMPDLLEEDPMEIVRRLVEGFLSSIGDFEQMAVAYAEKHPPAAVGAKNGADRARRDLAELLQATGTLPKELGQLRVLVDVRYTVRMIVEAVERFEVSVREAKLPPKKRGPILEASGEVRSRLEEVAGIAGEG